jgi:hypothetical protein
MPKAAGPPKPNQRYFKFYRFPRCGPDEVLGPIVMRVASFLPFQTSDYLNGYSFIEEELKRAQIGFRKTDNAFLAVDDVAALQAAADKLSPDIIGNRLGYWILIRGSPRRHPARGPGKGRERCPPACCRRRRPCSWPRPVLRATRSLPCAVATRVPLAPRDRTTTSARPGQSLPGRPALGPARRRFTRRQGARSRRLDFRWTLWPAAVRAGRRCRDQSASHVSAPAVAADLRNILRPDVLEPTNETIFHSAAPGFCRCGYSLCGQAPGALIPVNGSGLASGAVSVSQRNRKG